MTKTNRRAQGWTGRALALAALLGLVGLAAAAQAQASECLEAENIIIFYWSDASHTTLVGECSTGPCPGAGCFGTKSSFITAHNSGICLVCE